MGLTRFAYLLCGDRGLAEDLVQDAFTALYKRYGETLPVVVGARPDRPRRTLPRRARTAASRTPWGTPARVREHIVWQPTPLADMVP